MGEDLYGLLGVASTASAADVVAAYRAAAKRSHPDCGGDPAQFRAVRGAYLVLSDPKLRAAYDAKLAARDLPVVTISESMRRIGCTVRVPVPRWGSCEGCSGHGVVPKRARRSCRRCGGLGSVTEEIETHPYYLPCPACAGSGLLSESCAQCSGDGRRLVSLDRSVKLPAGARECVYRIAGQPAFRLRVRSLA